jgi:hypothetical protein
MVQEHLKVEACNEFPLHFPVVVQEARLPAAVVAEVVEVRSLPEICLLLIGLVMG